MIKSLTKIGEGTEGEVYSDGDFAYKVIDFGPVCYYDLSKLREKYLNVNHPNIVKIFEIYHDPEAESLIIKMELLQEIPTVDDYDEFERVRQMLWQSEDNINLLKSIETNNSEIQKMLNAIISAAIELKVIDAGFHNLMYDSFTGNYKQVDLF